MGMKVEMPGASLPDNFRFKTRDELEIDGAQSVVMSPAMLAAHERVHLRPDRLINTKPAQRRKFK